MTRVRGETGADLRAGLREAEATLEAIRAGEVDALVVAGPRGSRTLAIEGATEPYHVLLNAMTDGAVLLAADGRILFRNRRFDDLVGRSRSARGNERLQRSLTATDRPRIDALLARDEGGAAEFTIVRGRTATPVWISLSTLPLGPDAGAGVRMAIVTDLTERKGAEAKRLELMKRLITVEDEERRRIARELHDETGQSLTALLVGLRVLEQQTGREDVRLGAQRLRKIASETMENVGRLARGLHPSVLDDLGLLAAVRRYVRDYETAHGLTVVFRSEGMGVVPLPPLVQTTIYRILQEGLTNVARHARAGAVEIDLRCDDERLTLMIRDDGVGFETASAGAGAGGLGLHGMAERVALLGGTLELESTPGRGTLLRATVPCLRPGREARG